MHVVEIYNQDCVDYLTTLADNSVDVVFIDPPYNTKNKKEKIASYDNVEFIQRKQWKPFFADWDDIENYYEWSIEWLSEVRRVLKKKGSIFICGSFHNIPDVALALRATGFYTIQWIQWCIPNAFPNFAMSKPINANQTIIWARKNAKIGQYYDKNAARRYNDGKNLRDYWLINSDCQTGKKYVHPSKKPVPLVERAIDIALPKENGASVIDFFAGSGTTGIAVMNINRRYDIATKCILVEKDVEYTKVIKQRIKDEELKHA